MITETILREPQASDRDAIFAMMADPAGVAMAAFTAEDPHDREAFDAHLKRVLALPGVVYRVITDTAGTVVGTISTFPSDEGHPEITYWIDRAHWGGGHASRAVAQILEQTKRPVLARVAADNLGSRRVLEKAGFRVVGTDRGYAAARRTEIDELILKLDA